MLFAACDLDFVLALVWVWYLLIWFDLFADVDLLGLFAYFADAWFDFT